MDWFHAHCLSSGAPDTVVHLGAGSGLELDLYRTFDESRILLIEPQPDLAFRLRQAASSMAHVDVLQLALAEGSGQEMLARYSLSAFSSLNEPTGLLELYPGVEVVHRFEVQTIGPGELIESSGIDYDSENWLVVDAPSVATLVLDALWKPSFRSCFSHIFLRAGRMPLYAGDRPLADLLEESALLGYEVFGRVDIADPDLPRCHLILNPALRDAATARSALNEKELELASCANRVHALEDQIRSGVEDQQHAIESAGHRIEELTAQVESLRGELAAARGLQKLREADLEELQQRYTQVMNSNTKLRVTFGKLRERLTTIAPHLDELGRG